MDVLAKNRGRPPQDVFSCSPSDGEKLSDPWASVCKGQECRNSGPKVHVYVVSSSLTNFTEL